MKPLGPVCKKPEGSVHGTGLANTVVDAIKLEEELAFMAPTQKLVLVAAVDATSDTKSMPSVEMPPTHWGTPELFTAPAHQASSWPSPDGRLRKRLCAPAPKNVDVKTELPARDPPRRLPPLPTARTTTSSEPVGKLLGVEYVTQGWAVADAESATKKRTSRPIAFDHRLLPHLHLFAAGQRPGWSGYEPGHGESGVRGTQRSAVVESLQQNSL